MNWILPARPPYQPDEIYDALKQGDVLVRLGGLRVLRIGDDVYANGEKLIHRIVLPWKRWPVILC